MLAGREPEIRTSRATSMATRLVRGATLSSLLLLLLLLEQAACKSFGEQAQQGEEPSLVSRAEGSSRPSRGSAFSTADDGDDEPTPPATSSDAAPAAAAAEGSKPSEATAGIADDMRAHLKRRQKKADADLIKSNRGPIATVLFGVGDFLTSNYFRNVRKSLGIFAGAWVWYVLNTKTYMPPEVEE